MTCVDRALSQAAARRESYRGRGGSRGGGNPIIAHAGGGRSTLAYGATLETHAEQYKHFTGWPYTAIVRIATRLAAAEVYVGRKSGDSGYVGEYRRRGRKVPTRVRRRMPAYARKSSDDMEIVESHDLLTMLEDPNEVMTTWALFFMTICSLESTGKGFWWKFPGDRQMAYPLPSDWMTPVHTRERLFDHWTVSPRGALGETFELPPEEVIYFPLPDPSDPLGTLSPLQTQAPAIATDEAIQMSQYRSFENGMHPGMVLHVGRLPGMLPGQHGHRPVLTTDQRKDLIESVRTLYENAVNYNEPLILDGMVEAISRFTNTPLEMDYINSGGQTKSRIFQAFGVNPVIAGEITGVNRAQAAVAEALFLGQVVNPLGCLIGQTLTKHLRRTGDTQHTVWLEEQRPEDAELRLKEWSVGLTRGAVTDDEFRMEVLDLPPKEEDESGEEPPPDEEPAPQSEGEGGDGGGDPPSDEESENPKRAKAGKRVRPSLRATVEQLWTRNYEQHEASIIDAMGRFFREQAAEVTKELRAVMDQAPTLFGAPGAASQVTDRIFKPREWDAELRRAAMVPMMKAAFAGYLSARALWDSRKQKDLSPQEMEWIQNWRVPEAVKRRMTSWLSESFSQSYWEKINDTTYKRIARGIGRGLEEGQSIHGISKSIEAMVGDRKRAKVIAITETGGALNAGQHIQTTELEEAGLPVVKTWVTMGDDLVRPEHVGMEGVQVNGADGLFNVDGYKTPYPAQFSLPAYLRVNCRCTYYTDVIEDKARPQGEVVGEEGAEAPQESTPSPQAAQDTGILAGVVGAASTPSVTIDGQEQSVLETFGRIRGRTGGTIKDLAALSGAPTGADLTIGSTRTLVKTAWKHGSGKSTSSMMTVVGRDVDGRLVQTIHHMDVGTAARGRGTGTKTLSQVVDAGRRVGVDAVKLDALRAPWANGYYTWPRLGFDAKLPKKWLDDFATKLPKGLENAAKVSDLMRTKAGRKFWKENGQTITAEFDVKPGSTSSRVLEGYVKRKAARKELPKPETRITEEERKAIIATFEKQVVSDTVENLAAWDANGKLLLSKRGEAERVMLTNKDVAKLRGATVTHNHPVLTMKNGTKNEDMPLSGQDGAMLVLHGFASVRAVSKRYVSTLRIKDGAVIPDRKAHAKKVREAWTKRTEELMKEEALAVVRDVRAGKIKSPEEAAQRLEKFNQLAEHQAWYDIADDLQLRYVRAPHRYQNEP